jgi:hypothetical protein
MINSLDVARVLAKDSVSFESCGMRLHVVEDQVSGWNAR